jgi:hypothetical protein
MAASKGLRSTNTAAMEAAALASAYLVFVMWPSLGSRVIVLAG